MIADQAVINAGFDLRRYAMKPNDGEVHQNTSPPLTPSSERGLRPDGTAPLPHWRAPTLVISRQKVGLTGRLARCKGSHSSVAIVHSTQSCCPATTIAKTIKVTRLWYQSTNHWRAVTRPGREASGSNNPAGDFIVISDCPASADYVLAPYPLRTAPAFQLAASGGYRELATTSRSSRPQKRIF